MGDQCKNGPSIIVAGTITLNISLHFLQVIA